METCSICGFAWETVAAAEVGDRIRAGTAGIAAAVSAAPERAGVRPSPERWSALEYTAHVRDVLLHVRDRIVIALVEDEPTFKPLYREERVDLGLYALDTTTVVLTEVE